MKIWQTKSQSSSELIDEFLAGSDVQLDARLLPYEFYGSMAHAMGLSKIGILTESEVEQIRDSLSRLVEQEIEINPEDEDIHSLIEAHLIHELGDVGEKIHTGRSRNDQVLVDLRLFAKDYLQQIAIKTTQLVEVLIEFAKDHEFVPMPGTTHTRFAMPSSIGLWAASFADGLLESLTSIESAYQLINKSPLGSAAGYGVPLPLEREYVAELLDFDGVQLNPLNATSNRGKADFVVVSALAALMLDLSRLSADLIWGSSERFEFFILPREFCTGSSIMPNKHNPDLLEIMRAKAAGISAKLVGIYNISQGKISGYHRDHQELKEALMESLQTTSTALELMTELISNLKINKTNLRNAHSKELYAVDQMIREIQQGQPMRSAYRAVKENLDEVEMPDPIEALKARAHIGGPGNLGLDGLLELNQEISAKWVQRRIQMETKLTKLLQS